MNDNYENINFSLIRENIMQSIEYLKKASNNDVEQLVGNDAIWQALSRQKLVTSLTENKEEIQVIIMKLETYLSALDLAYQIKTLKEEEKLAVEETVLEELKIKINQLKQELNMKLSTI